MPLGVPPIDGRRPDKLPKSPRVPVVDPRRDGAEVH